MARNRMIGPDGEPLSYEWEGNGKGRVVLAEKSKAKGKSSGRVARTVVTNSKQGNHITAKFLGQFNQFMQQLSNINLPAEVRAQDPFANHVWVFAAAMATATIAGQAPFGVFRETGKTLQIRRKNALEEGLPVPYPRSGRARKALLRYSTPATQKRAANFRRLLVSKGVEQDFNSPLADLFANPNPYQDLQQLLTLTHLWMAVRGELFWVLTDDEGNSVMPGQVPTRIWPLGPDCFYPVHEYGTVGDLIGWDYSPACYMPNASYSLGKMRLSLSDVVQFKYPNPMNPIRGMSRISAAALGIESDLLIKSHNRALIKNFGVPRGLITYAGNMKKQDEEAYIRKWKQQHEGQDNHGKLAILQAGFQYQNIGLSQEDMQYLEQLKWDRDEVLAAMGMPGSVLGLTDFVNYATQLGQDKNLWDKLVIPLFRLEESAVDRSALFFAEGDNVFPLFDITDVEALRAGMESRINMVNILTQPAIHMPPARAFELVGQEVDPYDADDVSFVSPLQVPAKDAATIQPSIPGPLAGSPSPADPNAGDPAGGDPPAPAGDLPPSNPPGTALQDNPAGKALENAFFRLLVSRRTGVRTLLQKTAAPAGIVKTTKHERIIKAKLNWSTFIKFQGVLERATSDDYRKWISVQKKETLERFDKLARAKASRIDLSASLPDPKKAENLLRQQTRPAHAQSLEQLYSLAKEEFGVPVFQVDDDRIMRHFVDREQFFVEQTTAGMLKKLTSQLSAGASAGESLPQLRERLAQTFDIQAGSSKTLTVARTESAAFANGTRNEMMGAQGYEEEQWTSAGDLNVRDDHTTFDEAGPKPRGFNYLTLIASGEGKLTYPHDMECTDAGQVVNCRCFKIPTS